MEPGEREYVNLEFRYSVEAARSEAASSINFGFAMDSKNAAALIFAYRQAISSLPPDQQTNEGRMALAARILALAEAGETDPAKLVSRSLSWAFGAESYFSTVSQLNG